MITRKITHLILHMLPGVGKTTLARRYPDRFVDTDDIFAAAGLDFIGRVHLIPQGTKLDAIDALDDGRIVLTNDSSIAYVSYLHSTLAGYLECVARRPDLDRSLASTWYADARANSSIIIDLSRDPIAAVTRRHVGQS